MKSGTEDGGVRLWPVPSCELGECLIWDERIQSFWWVDVHAGVLYRAKPGDSAPDRWQFGEALGHVALTDSPQSVVLGSASSLLLFNINDGSQRKLATVPHASAAMRLNDGRCDRHGNLVFGTMLDGGEGGRGAFWWFSGRNGLQPLDLPPPAIPNSICFSPEGDLLYFTDSKLKVIHVCDYDPSTGAVSGIRVFTDPGEVAWEPDGSCVDATGCVWNAQWGGRRIVRYRPDGSLDRIIASRAIQPTCPCIGGPNLDTLYATTARIGLDANEISDADGAVLFWQNLGLRGLPEGRVASL